MTAKIVSKILDQEILSMEYPPDSIANDLINPCMSEFNFARREAAWFRASAIRAWALSLEPIIKKDIKIEFLISPQVDKTTYRVLKEATDKEKLKIFENYSNEILNKAILLKLDPFNHTKQTGITVGQILSYLVLSEKLEFKFVDVLDIDRLKVYDDELDDEDLQTELNHIKKGYFSFPCGNDIAYEGSFNESAAALNKQGESCQLMVTGRDDKRVKDLKKRIDDKWNEEREGVRVRGLSKEILNKLEVIKKTDPIKTGNDGRVISTGGFIKDERKLRDHQRCAIKAWHENGFKGILDHATGSGKTFTALKIIESLRISRKQLFVIVGLPFRPLADQWRDEIDSFFSPLREEQDFKFTNSIGCYSSGDRDWELKFSKEINSFRNSILNKEGRLSVLVVVNDTLSSSSFQKILQNSQIDEKRFLVVGDECHRYANAKNLEALPKKAGFKLGLSATAFDNMSKLTAGEKKMEKYFGGICHEYSLKDGIKDGHLCKYIYKPIPCVLDEEELFEWKEYLGNYNNDLNSIDKDSNDHIKNIEKLVSSSKAKYIAFNKLIREDIKDKQNSIIFVGLEKKDGISSIDITKESLNNEQWLFQKITADESPQERKDIIFSFARGDTDVILAKRILDEGIDIPSIKTAIILASSVRRRQFVQRRGRVLRDDGSKKIATIYDFIILPPTTFGKSGLFIMEKEMSRVKEMGQDAENKDEIIAFEKQYKGMYEPA